MKKKYGYFFHGYIFMEGRVVHVFRGMKLASLISNLDGVRSSTTSLVSS